MTEKIDEPKPVVEPLRPTVVDPHNAPVQYFDWIVTGGPGPAPGTLNLVLAALDYSMTNDRQPRAIIQSRLRMSTGAASNLHRFLGDLLSGGATPPASPPVPANKLI